VFSGLSPHKRIANPNTGAVMVIAMQVTDSALRTCDATHRWIEPQKLTRCQSALSHELENLRGDNQELSAAV
jgi:hypothetical protein